MNSEKSAGIRRSAGQRSERQFRILTTTVGSFPWPPWLAAMPTEQTLMDTTRVRVMAAQGST